jgi:NAD-dependent SIR2 family protein deacetylase
MERADVFAAAARALRGARTLVITAGAGMGVDSGLPDFRGERGFWNAYPMYERLGLSFVEAANPEHFEGDPAFGWGFYGHRLQLYRDTVPHQGFHILQRFARDLGLATFVVTSNVDGQFQKAGFAPEAICEVHGSIHVLQCTSPCGDDLWDNEEDVPVDPSTMRARHVPRCRRCGGVARPNILMFGDYAWLASRAHAQRHRLEAFLTEQADAPAVVIELGAGTSIPTIRALSEQLGRRPGTTVVRINPREPDIVRPHLSLAQGALEGLAGIERALG